MRLKTVSRAMGTDCSPWPSADARVRHARDLTLPERYRVIRHIANGGMASVWCAEDRSWAGVSRSSCSPSIRRRRPRAQRFEREARAAARLSGAPHVVTIYDVGEHDGPRRSSSWSTSPAARSPTRCVRRGGPHHGALALAARGGGGARLRPRRAASCTATSSPPTCCSTTAIGSHVADFGIAQLAAEDDSSPQTGRCSAPPPTSRPSRRSGEPATAASDRYSLAVVAFELLDRAAPVPGRALRRPGAPAHRASPRRRPRRTAPPRRRRRARARHGQGPRRALADRAEFVDALEGALSRQRPRRPQRDRARPVRRSGRTGPQRARSARAPRRWPGRAGPLRTRPPLLGAGRRPRRRPPRAPADAPPPGHPAPRLRGAEPPAARRSGRSRTPAAARAGRAGCRRRGRRLAAGPAITAPQHGPPRQAPRHADQPPARRQAEAARPQPSPSQAQAAATTTTATHQPRTGDRDLAADDAAPDGRDARRPRPRADASGSYTEAIPVLRQALAAASPSSLTYAYALYDLGRSLRLAGTPRRRCRCSSSG